MSDIQQLEATLRALGDKFDTGLSSYEERMASLVAPKSSSCPDVAALAADFLQFKAFVKETFLVLRRQVEVIAAGLDSMEMKSRSKVILFHGLCEDVGENVTTKVTSIVVNKLGIPHISGGNIVVCHRLGQPQADSKRPRPVLVRFENLSDRSDVWKNKTKLKGSDVSVSEFLTRTRHHILVEARKQLDMKQVWSQDGTVIIVYNGRRHKVNTMTQLVDLLKTAPQQESKATTTTVSAPKTEGRSRREIAKSKK